MLLLDLPNELLSLIAVHLSPKDLSSFLRGNKQLSYLLKRIMYKHAIEDKLGVTAFMWAASKGYEPLARLLLETGVSGVNDRDCEGLTALHRAASEGHTGMIKMLLDHGADIHARTNDLATVLHWAVSSQSEDVVRLVIKSGFCRKEINFQSFDGASMADNQQYRGTALHWAAVGGYESIAQLLLEEGADASLVDNTGRMAISWAVEFGYGGLCRILLTEGLELNVRDIYGLTILELAESWQNREIIRLLKEY